MFELQRHNTILQLALHLRERQARRCRCCLCAYQDVDFHAGLLDGTSEREVEIVVDFALVIHTACGCAGGSQAGEKDGGGGCDRGEYGGPFRTVFGNYGVQLCVGGGRFATGEGVDAGYGAEGEEDVEDVRALAEICQCCVP